MLHSNQWRNWRFEPVRQSLAEGCPSVTRGPLAKTRKKVKTVVLKREPFGSLREEFLIPGRNWGGKAVEVFIPISLFQHIKKLHSEVGWDWNVYSRQAQAAPSSSFEAVRSVHCLAETRSQGRCWAANRLSHHPELSGRAIHGEVDGLDMGRHHGQRFDLLCHTHKPQKGPYLFVQTTAQTSKTRAEAVEPDPRCQLRSQEFLFQGGSNKALFSYYIIR